MNNLFSFPVFEKNDFGQGFINWVKVLLKNQESCVINGGLTTRHFKLGKAKRH